MVEDIHEAAERLRNKLHKDEKKGNGESDHFLVDIAKLEVEKLKLFTDINNEALTQLDKGKWKNYFIDETEIFATAIDFALNPFPDVEEELLKRGITHKVKYQNDKGELEEKEEPIRIVVAPLLSFAKEWMRRRHPVNRLRVDEVIKLAGASKTTDQVRLTERAGMLEATGMGTMRRGL